MPEAGPEASGLRTRQCILGVRTSNRKHVGHVAPFLFRPRVRHTGRCRVTSDRSQLRWQMPRVVVGVQNHLAIRHDPDHGYAAVGAA
jgi:hypothetical protein